MITIKGISLKTLQSLHDFYLPKTIITSTQWIESDKLYIITINPLTLLSINQGDITLDLGAVLYTLKRGDYVSLEIM